VKRLPFERTYLLDSVPCPRCAGSGVFAAPARPPRECWNCRGLGRKLTQDARELFYEISELLGAPVEHRETRIQTRHIETIRADRVRPGMAVTDTHVDRRRTPRSVATVQQMPLEQLRVTFVDGSIVNVPPYELFARELTRAELDRVDALMAQRLGEGVKPAPA